LSYYITYKILPSVGYYPKEDIRDCKIPLKPQAEEVILQNILKEEAGEKNLKFKILKRPLELVKLHKQIF
jgi:SulP family sulfate permease